MFSPMHHIFFPPRFYLVCEEDFVDRGASYGLFELFLHLFFQEVKGPSGIAVFWFRTGNGGDLCLFFTIEFCRLAWSWGIIQGSFQPSFAVAPAYIFRCRLCEHKDFRYCFVYFLLVMSDALSVNTLDDEGVIIRSHCWRTAGESSPRLKRSFPRTVNG